MHSQHFQGSPLSGETSRVCLLFDPKDGRIVHAHGHTALQSKKPIEPAELESRARRHAKRLGKNVEGVKALHVPLASIQSLRVFKVNAGGDGVVAIDYPRLMRRSD